MQSAVLLWCVVILLPRPLSAQTRRLAPDPVPRQTFHGDSASAAIPVANWILTVRAERGADLRTTGRYLVLLDNRPLAAATSQELVLGAPSVAFVSVGEPSVVLLSTYTGGQGAAAVPGYYLKLIVLSHSGVQAFTLASESVGQVSSDRVISISRPSDGQFELSLWGGIRITYANRQLDVMPEM